jgi:DNA mismatch repair ATPase MutS
MTDHVSSHYLNAAFGEEKVTALTPVNDADLTFIERFNKLLDPKKEVLTPREIQKIAFDIVANNTNFKSTIIDTSCIDKLEIVGGGENNQQHLLNHIFNDITTATGKAQAAFTFCHPTNDVLTLRNRQTAIALLSKINSTNIDTALTTIKNNEEKSYVLEPKSPVNNEVLKTFYFGQSYYKKYIKNA